VAVSSLPTRD